MISLLLISTLALADAEMPIDGLAKCKLGKTEFNVILASEPGKDKKVGDAGSADLFIEDGKISFVEKATGDGAEYEFSNPHSGSVCDKTAGYKLGKAEVGLLYKKIAADKTESFSLAVYSVKSRKILARESGLVVAPTKVAWDKKKLTIEPAKPAPTVLPTTPADSGTPTTLPAPTTTTPAPAPGQ